jgi:hypothetical protein
MSQVLGYTSTDAASYYNENELLRANNDKNPVSKLFQGQQPYVYPQHFNYSNLSKETHANKPMDQNYVQSQAGWAGFGYGQPQMAQHHQIMPQQPNYMDNTFDQQAINAAYQQNTDSSKNSEKVREATERPLVRLSVNLIHTYKNINEASFKYVYLSKSLLELLQSQDS